MMSPLLCLGLQAPALDAEMSGRVLAPKPDLLKFSQNGQRHIRTPEGAGQVASVGISQGVLATQTF
jgi:hypothetical protein